MEAEDLISMIEMHGKPDSEVIIVIDGKEYKLTGTVIGDEDESAVYVYAEER